MSKAKIALAAVVWLVILTVAVLIWKLFLQPAREESIKKEQDARQQEIVKQTEGTSKYRAEIAIGIDSFSGYALFRTEEFQANLSQEGIRANLVDDGADYEKRLKGLEVGDLQLALFPADALIKSSAALGRVPATIVAVIDESRGADAMVAYKSRFADSKNLDLLNNPETRFVLVGDSPSETLARVVMHDFDLRKMGSDPFIRVASPDALIKAYKNAKPTAPEVYVTWEPYVSQLLANDQLHVLFDSAKLTGYVVDTLVVSRDYLLKHQDDVEKVLKAYFKTLHAYSEGEKFKKWIIADAKKTGMELNSEQAGHLMEGIQWRNTQENFIHFGLRGGNIVHVEDILARIVSVLKSSNTIKEDPTDGKLSRLFFDRPLASLQSANFHPGLQDEKIREEVQLKSLTDKQWESLVPVGTLNVQELTFARGNATLTDVSRGILDELAAKLRSWPQYYLMIRGNASNKGNISANETLAAQRASAALEYLQSQGIPLERMKAIRGDLTGVTGVSFQVGELPY